MNLTYPIDRSNLTKGKKIVLIGISILLLLLIPIFIKNTYVMRIICQILYYSVMAGSLNVINGYTNQFSIGHAGFIAVGCYICVIFQTRLGVDFWFSALIAALVTALVGYLVSLPTLNLSGVYLSIVTLGFSEIIRLIALNWTPVTGGSLGIKAIPAPRVLGMAVRKASDYYYLFLILAILFIFVTYRVLHSRVGRAWMSIREDQLAAASLGVSINRYKSINFIYASFWAGLVGAFYGPYIQFVDSSLFTLDEGFNVLAMVIIGGMGTLSGPVMGAVIVNTLNELLRTVSEYRLVIYGLLIIAMMWFRPQGLIGTSNSVLADKKMDKNAKAEQEVS